MSKKRIHDLAKDYGMSGKDLASKLRDFGFSRAKSHMSALDEFELMQAEALLDVNGIVRSGGEQTAGTVAESGGGLKIRRKSKKTSEIEVLEVAPQPFDGMGADRFSGQARPCCAMPFDWIRSSGCRMSVIG